MTEHSAGAVTASPQPVRAVGGVSTTSSEHPGPAILLPRRRPGYFGPVHVIQLLLAEIALVAVLATVAHGIVPSIAAVLGAAVLLFLTLAPRSGRWWLEWRVMTWRYRRRRQVRADPYGDDRRLAALRALAPGLVLEDVPVADGTRVGVARDDAGWYAVAAVTATTPMGEHPGGVPLETLADALAAAEQPGAVLQVVIETVPAPSMDSHPSSPAGYSYRHLLGTFGAVPADRATWIAVRLEARSLAESVGDDHADLELAPVVVAALMRRVAKSLHRVGISHRLLDSDALLSALARSCDLESWQKDADPAQPREDWSEWHSSRLSHRSFWIRGWPPVGQAAALLDALSTAPSAMTTVALILALDDDRRTVDLRALVRVAAPANKLAATCQSLTRSAEQARAELFQLDGEQGPAVYASAPTGGGAR